MMGDEERVEMMNHHHRNQEHSYQEKMLEIWDEQAPRHQAAIKQDINNNAYVIMSSPKSPPNKSCVATATFHNLNEDNNDNNHNGLNLSEVGQNIYS